MPVEIRRQNFRKGFAQIDAGGVDQNVRRKVALTNRSHRALGPVRLFQVGFHGISANIFRLKAFCRFRELLRAPRRQNYARAGESQRARHREPDSGIAAGDERRAVREIEQFFETERHDPTGSPMAKLCPTKYFFIRASAVRACASMPSSREIRAVTGASVLQASRSARCQVNGFRNLCTESPAE